jgi:hypothetical protein
MSWHGNVTWLLWGKQWVNEWIHFYCRKAVGCQTGLISQSTRIRFPLLHPFLLHAEPEAIRETRKPYNNAVIIGSEIALERVSFLYATVVKRISPLASNQMFSIRVRAVVPFLSGCARVGLRGSAWNRVDCPVGRPVGSNPTILTILCSFRIAAIAIGLHPIISEVRVL